MVKSRITRAILVFLVIASGNIFWYLFIQSISATHLLSSSVLTIVISLLGPIVTFSFYLSLLLFLSMFVRKKIILFFIVFLSMFDYSLLIENGYLSVLGELIITFSIYFFLVHFHQVHVIDKYKTSVLGQLSLSFSNTALIISIVLGFNFYNFYVHILSSQDILVTNKVMAKTLSPVVKIYEDDLGVTDLNETFAVYSKRRSIETRKSPQEIQKQVEQRLAVSVTGTDTMKDAIKRSLDNSIFKFVNSYRKQIPILVSLGLGVITQTLISTSTFLSNILTVLLLRLFLFLKLIRFEKEKMVVDLIVPSVT